MISATHFVFFGNSSTIIPNRPEFSGFRDKKIEREIRTHTRIEFGGGPEEVNSWDSGSSGIVVGINRLYQVDSCD